MRARRLFVGICWVSLMMFSCGVRRTPPPAVSGAGLSELTPSERRDLEMLTKMIAAPCENIDASIDECVRQKLQCNGCSPAARFLFRAVRDGQPRPQIEAAYRLRFGNDAPKPIDLQGTPVMGEARALVTVVEFADYECPHCSRVVEILDRLVRDYSPNVRIAFKNYPLPAHVNAEPAARAAVAAQQQGKFWQMHHKMFENQQALTESDLERYAQEIGLDMPRFKSDMVAPETAARVKHDQTDGNVVGVNGTPAIYVNGRAFELKLFDLATDLPLWVEDEIERLTGNRPASASPAPSTSASARR